MDKESTSTMLIDEKSNDGNSDFYNTGRVGRRNALPDILGQHCTTSTADLPDQLSALSTRDDKIYVTTTSITADQSSSSSSNSNFNNTGPPTTVTTTSIQSNTSQT